jgi:hypothetical protein
VMPPLESLSLTGIITIALICFIIVFLMLLFSVYTLYKLKIIKINLETINIIELINLFITIGSFVTVIITIVFLIHQHRLLLLQTENNIKLNEGNVLGFITNNSLTVDKLFITNPELRPYFYNKKGINKDDNLYETVSATAEYLLDYYDSLLVHMKLAPYLNDYYRKSWESNIIDSFLWSPILCSYLEENKTWFSPELYSLYEKARNKKPLPE